MKEMVTYEEYLRRWREKRGLEDKTERCGNCIHLVVSGEKILCKAFKGMFRQTLPSGHCIHWDSEKEST